MENRRCACRIACCTSALAAALWAPALLRVVLLLYPPGAGVCETVMSLALAATLVACPVLVKTMLGAATARRTGR